MQKWFSLAVFWIIQSFASSQDYYISIRIQDKTVASVLKAEVSEFQTTLSWNLKVHKWGTYTEVLRLKNVLCAPKFIWAVYSAFDTKSNCFEICDIFQIEMCDNNVLNEVSTLRMKHWYL